MVRPGPCPSRRADAASAAVAPPRPRSPRLGPVRALLLALTLGPCLAPAACAGTAPRAARIPAGAAGAPAPPPTAMAEGDAARRERRTSDALAAYERAIAEDPTSVPAHLRYVETLSADGRRSVARDRYVALAAAPGAPEVVRVLAARLQTDGSATAVRAVYVEAARRTPADPWWRLAIAEVDLEAADRWIRRHDHERTEGDRPAAAEAFERAHQALARAESAIESAAARGAGLAELNLYRGLARSLEGDLLPQAAARTAAYRAAADAFQGAVRADPTMVDAWADLGDARLRADEKDEALAAYLRASRLAPSDPDLRTNLGVVLHALERDRDAAKQFAEAARLDPTAAAPLLSEGDAWAAAREYEKALDAYGAALERDPALVEAHGRRGAVLEHLGRLPEARQEYALYVERGGADAADVKRRIERLLSSEGPP